MSKMGTLLLMLTMLLATCAQETRVSDTNAWCLTMSGRIDTLSKVLEKSQETDVIIAGTNVIIGHDQLCDN